MRKRAAKSLENSNCLRLLRLNTSGSIAEAAFKATSSRMTFSIFLCLLFQIFTSPFPVHSESQPGGLGKSLGEHVQNMSRAELQSLVKSYRDSAAVDGLLDDIMDEAMSENSPIFLTTTTSTDHPHLLLFLGMSDTPESEFNSNSTNNRKREIESLKNLGQQVLLPLEKLFPQLHVNTTAKPYDPEKSHHEPVNLQVKGHEDEQEYYPEKVHQTANSRLTSALLNHSIHNNYESDDELDRLVFSQLPQGSKLILRTVKIVKTDEDGNEEPIGDSAVSWDMIPVNGTDDEEYEDDGSVVVRKGKGRGRKRKRIEHGHVVRDPFDLYGTDGQAEGREEPEPDTEQEEPESATDDVQESAANTVSTGVEADMPDLHSAGSHHTTARYQNYKKKHGANEREKVKKDKYFHGQDHAKEKIKTITDSDGKKLTDYTGTEKELTDYKNAHGKAISDEHERYKNSKKKNKGRKVTGFKRVYHKEEFQRTEHFYDDEEAKRIAESYGLTDQKEKSDHGTKQDKRKYHGSKIEHTDIDKLKNEHITKNGHHKGSQHSNEHADKHKDGQKYSLHSQSHTHSQAPAKQYHAHAQQQQYQQHPNHNYQASYSNQNPTIGKLVQYAPATLVSGFTASSPPFLSQKQNTNQGGQNTYNYNNGGPQQAYRAAAAGSQIESSILPTPLPLMLAKPSEMKVFFAERERKIPELNPSPNYYAPNFGPSYKKHVDEDPEASSDETSTFYSKIGNATSVSSEESGSDEVRSNATESESDPVPKFYSTILKMSPTRPKKVLRGGNLLGIQKSKGVQVSSEIIFPEEQQQQKSKALGIGYYGNSYSTWLPIGSESTNSPTIFGDDDAQNVTNSNFNSKEREGYKNSTRMLPQVLISKPMPYRVRRPLLQRQLAFRPSIPLRHGHGLGHGQHSHFYGTTLVNPSQMPAHTPSYAPATTMLRRLPIPTYPQIMNGFVNSVTGVFGRVG